MEKKSKAGKLSITILRVDLLFTAKRYKKFVIHMFYERLRP